jgi:hypothetical protein
MLVELLLVGEDVLIYTVNYYFACLAWRGRQWGWFWARQRLLLLEDLQTLEGMVLLLFGLVCVLPVFGVGFAFKRR